MADYDSRDVDTAAHLARMDEVEFDDRPTRAEIAAEDAPQRFDPWSGRCVLCGGVVSPGLPGGSCLVRGRGPAHPSCRDIDVLSRAAVAPAPEVPRA